MSFRNRKVGCQFWKVAFELTRASDRGNGQTLRNRYNFQGLG